jgi:hypothetical protein
MNHDDPIAAYLERVSRALGRWQPGRRRILAEIEDHLRERVETGQEPDEAVARFGDAADVAAGLARPPRRAFTAVLGIALALAAGTVYLVVPGSSRATPVAISPSALPVPLAVVATADTSARGHPGALPTDVHVDAYAPLAGGEVLAFTAYSARGHLCYLTYIAHPGRLAPFRRGGAESDAGAVACRRSDPTPPIDMMASGGSGMQFILYGTVTRAATDLAITDAHGQTRTFSLPRVPSRAEPSRQVVIVDLTTVGIGSFDRLALLAGGRVIAHETFGSA